MTANISFLINVSKPKIVSSTAERSALDGKCAKSAKKIAFLLARAAINDYFCHQTAHNDDDGNIYYNNKSTNRQHDKT